MYYERALVCPEESFFLLGPRGTGKSTWLHRRFPEAKLIDLLDERQRFRLMSQPGAFALELEALQPGSWVIVDEIQKMPDLLNEVHRFIESRRLRFALCGSSARKLRVAGVNLLAGRALSRTPSCSGSTPAWCAPPNNSFSPSWRPKSGATCLRGWCAPRFLRIAIIAGPSPMCATGRRSPRPPPKWIFWRAAMTGWSPSR